MFSISAEELNNLNFFCEIHLLDQRDELIILPITFHYLERKSFLLLIACDIMLNLLKLRVFIILLNASMKMHVTAINLWISISDKNVCLAFILDPRLVLYFCAVSHFSFCRMLIWLIVFSYRIVFGRVFSIGTCLFLAKRKLVFVIYIYSC